MHYLCSLCALPCSRHSPARTLPRPFKHLSGQFSQSRVDMLPTTQATPRSPTTDMSQPSRHSIRCTPRNAHPQTPSHQDVLRPYIPPPSLAPQHTNATSSPGHGPRYPSRIQAGQSPPLVIPQRACCALLQSPTSSRRASSPARHGCGPLACSPLEPTTTRQDCPS